MNGQLEKPTVISVVGARPQFVKAAIVSRALAENGVSEVLVNGKRLGARWYGQHIYDISHAVKPGANELVIKVTTVLHNHMRTLDKDSCAGFWTRPTRRAVPAGLIGPVQLMAGEE